MDWPRRTCNVDGAAGAASLLAVVLSGSTAIGGASATAALREGLGLPVACLLQLPAVHPCGSEPAQHACSTWCSDQ